MASRYLFLTLNTFSATGGIEKVCRAAGKALYEIAAEKGHEVMIYSMYDRGEMVNERYFPASCFKGFNGRKINFVLSAIRERKPQVVLLSHINLLPVGYLIKKASPKTRLVLMAHGIEVWEKLSGMKARMLPAVDLFLPVSQFTAGKLQSANNISSHKIQVVNNCLDPFLKKHPSAAIQKKLAEKYDLEKGDVVLLTVTRLKHSEQYKGYDKVIESLVAVKKKLPRVKYLIVGKYDTEEKARLESIVAKEGMTDVVIFAGFVKDEELQAHFELADVYIMPSTGEGFGIVFIEALYYGLPVIAGNQDGSVDALAKGEFGMLINPTGVEAIAEAIVATISNPGQYRPDSEKLMQYFGYETYRRNMGGALGFVKNSIAKQPATVV